MNCENFRINNSMLTITFDTNFTKLIVKMLIDAVFIADIIVTKYNFNHISNCTTPSSLYPPLFICTYDKFCTMFVILKIFFWNTCRIVT